MRGCISRVLIEKLCDAVERAIPRNEFLAAPRGLERFADNEAGLAEHLAAGDHTVVERSSVQSRPLAVC